jgi:hypothetical protein
MSAQIVPSSRRAYFDSTGGRLLTAYAAAKRIQRTPRMVRYLIARGELASVRIGKLLFCLKADVERYCREYSRG